MNEEVNFSDLLDRADEHDRCFEDIYLHSHSTQATSTDVWISSVMYSGRPRRKSTEIQCLGLVWTRVEYEREKKGRTGNGMSPVQSWEAKESWICVVAEKKKDDWWSAGIHRELLASIHHTRRVRKTSMNRE